MVLLVAFVSACCSCVVDETSRRGVYVCGCLMDMMKWLWLWLGHAKMKKDKSCCCWAPLRSGVRRCWYIRPQTHKHDHGSTPHTKDKAASIHGDHNLLFAAAHHVIEKAENRRRCCRAAGHHERGPYNLLVVSYHVAVERLSYRINERSFDRYYCT